MWKYCTDQIICRCVLEVEIPSILSFCHLHAYGGHFGLKRMTPKMLEYSLFWPFFLFQDAYFYCKAYENSQKTWTVNSRDQMPLTPILICEIFYVLGIDFMGPFSFFGNSNILLVVDYVSKWVEAKVTRLDDGKTVVKFIKSHIFIQFAMISDRGMHFSNQVIATLLKRYHATHYTSITYHLQTSRQV